MESGILANYLVISGRASVTEGGASELLPQLAQVYMGPGTKFPANSESERCDVVLITSGQGVPLVSIRCVFHIYNVGEEIQHSRSGNTMSSFLSLTLLVSLHSE